MSRRIKLVCLLLVAVLLTGCTMPTVEQMYKLPKRSEDYNNLQSAIDQAMDGLDYCAPLAGEHQQTVQMADLDGDGEQEYLLFAKGSSDRPLRILVFRNIDDAFVHVDTIESNGSAFDRVEYVQMDGRGGVELIIGRQVSDQVLRRVSVYTFTNGTAEQLITVNYTKFLAVDLNADGLGELFVLRPGQTDTDHGVAELYGIEKGTMERSNEVDMSGPVDKLKRILIGKLHDGQPAVYVASTVGDTALITDVFARVDGLLSNVSFSNESGTSVQTMRNYYVYADDIDNDGVVELPATINMFPLGEARSTDRHDLIRWYAMTADGGEVDKMFTYHNFVGGWYMQLEGSIVSKLAVMRVGNGYEFYLWDEETSSTRKLMTVFALTGQNREEQGLAEERFVLHKTDSTVYAASLEEIALEYAITQDSVIRSFHLIHQDWKTGET